jgi:6-phosphofructokinase 1
MGVQPPSADASRGSVDGRTSQLQPALKDVGLWLKAQLKHLLTDADIKYIDPSYLIRSVPAASNDRVYCRMLAHGAVHAAFAGYTGISVGLVNTHLAYLPLPLLIQAPRKVDPQGELWLRLLGAIRQPDFEKPPALADIAGCAGGALGVA